MPAEKVGEVLDGSQAADAEHHERLQAAVARAEGRDMQVAYAVNEAMIGLWTDALMDDNPVYVDEAAARATGRPGVIAPPTMIQAWSMPKLSRMARAARDVPGFAPYLRGAEGAPADPGDGGGEIYRILAERGYSNSAAVSSRQVYHREMQPGERVRCVATVEAVSALKRTAMGFGHFVTTRLDYSDQEGRSVATQHWTVLRFREPTAAEQAGARARAGEAAKPASPAEKPADSGAPLSGRPEAGQATPPIVFPITPIFVIATALATHDFYAIHHDVDWARGIGQPGIFTNILTTTGLVGGVMTRWGGPAVRLRSTDLRLFTPNYPGDALTLQGRVTAVDGETVTMAVSGSNRLGTHVEAVVTGDFPNL
jgi:acyl dehydratase